MGIEGGNFPTYDSYAGDLERAYNRSGERRRGPERPSWLSGIINSEKLARAMEYRSYADHSPEWVIMDALLAKKVEGGAELDPIIKARLGNLIGILRMAFYPNMNEREQDFIRRLVTQTTTVDFSSLQYEVTPETHEDVQWLWSTFGLSIPTRQQRNSLPPAISAIIGKLGLSPKSTDK